MTRIHTWPPSEAAHAARINVRALRQWAITGVLPLLKNDRKSKGAGDHSGYSLPRVVQAAITRHLDLLNVSVSFAAKAAFEFTDRGNTGRQPGELFAVGKTILLITPDGGTVHNIFANTAHSDVCSSETVLAVDVNKIVAQVNNSLFRKE